MAEMSDFQRAFLQKGTGQKLYTELEFAEAVDKAVKMIKDQFMDATHFAIVYENEQCAKIAHDMEKERHEAVGNPIAGEFTKSAIAEAILKRIKDANTEPTISSIR
jgi:hypothetical protein